MVNSLTRAVGLPVNEQSPIDSTSNQTSHKTSDSSQAAPAVYHSSLVQADPLRGNREAAGQNSIQTAMMRDSLAATLPTLPPTLKRGDKSSAVSELQTRLKTAGYDCGSTAGSFGPITERMLKSFQRDHGLAASGLFDNATRATLEQTIGFINGNGRVSAAFADSRAQRELQAIDILHANKVTPHEGQFYVIQIDQDNPPATASQAVRDQWLQSYSGGTSVFKYQQGRMVEVSERVYRSASHPNMVGSDVIGGTIGYQDVDKDGIADIGHMRTGVYQYTRTGERYSPVGGANLAVARDTNHNGVIDAGEAQKKYYATGLQIHAGEDDHPRSAACQTMPPVDYTAMQQDLSKNHNKNFTYLLVRRPNDTTGANPF